MDPISYKIQPVNPLESVGQGLQLGFGLQERDLKLQQAQLAARQAQQMQADLHSVANNPNAGGEDYAKLMTQYPQLSEHFKRGWDVLDSTQRQNRLNQSVPVYAALQGGNTTVAIDLLRQQAAAAKNSGNEREAAAMEALARTAEMDRGSAKFTVGSSLMAGLGGPDKFAEIFGKLSETTTKQALAPAELATKTAEATIKGVQAAAEHEKVATDIANVKSTIADRAGRLSFDQDKAFSDYQVKIAELNQKNNTLEGDARKLVNESTLASVTSENASGQLYSLADKLDSLGGGYGSFGTAAEAWAGLTGNQDGMSAARQEYVRLRNSQAIKNMPAGAASDSDVAMAMKGFPPETADAKYLASFVRGMSKLQQYDAINQRAQAEWVNAVGHLGRPKADIEVAGVKVPAGSSFTDFSKQFIGKQADTAFAARKAESAVNAAKGRGYMQYATPPAAQPTVAPDVLAGGQ